MPISVGAILPIIMLISLGYIAVRRDIVGEGFGKHLNKYVFYFGAPALLFRNTALTEFPVDMPYGLWASYYGAMVLCFALGALSSFFFAPAMSGSGRVISGFGSSFSNSVMLGIPITLIFFGPEGAIPLFLIFVFHGLIFITATTVMMEFGRPEGANMKQVMREVAKSISSQNVLIALIAGVLYGTTGIGFAPFIDQFLDMLGSSTIPVALIMTGATLANVRFRSSLGVGIYVGIIKLVIHPCLVFVLGYYVFDLPELWVAVTTVLAAMPSGIFTTMFAETYNVATDEASVIILLTTLVSAGSLIFVLSFFEHLAG